MRRALFTLVLLAAVVAAGWTWNRNRLLELRVAQDRVAAEAVAAAAASTAARDRNEIRRLQLELHRAIEERELVAARIQAVREEVVEQREARRERLRRATAPPPEGVRLALLTINRRLREDGHPGLRVLQATRIEDKALRDVEISEHREDLLATSLYRAAEVRFELDRATATLTLRCFRGMVFGAGVERALPESGIGIELQSVDGELWEEALPFLMRATGAYPRTEVAEPAIPSVDRVTIEIWAERLDTLLTAAETEVHYRVGKIHDLRDGQFEQVVIHGHGVGKRLATSMKAKRVDVVVDPAGDVVELRLREGVILRADGDVPISADQGYSLLLHGVGVEEARAIMLGMVSERR